MRLYIDKGGRETRRRRKAMQGGGETAYTYGAEGVIELDAVIQSSQDAVMKLPLSFYPRGTANCPPL